MKICKELQDDPRTKLGEALWAECKRLGRPLSLKERARFTGRWVKENYPEYWAHIRRVDREMRVRRLGDK